MPDNTSDLSPKNNSTAIAMDVIATQQDEDRVATLFSAIENKQLEVVKRCLANDPALISQPDERGWYPIHYAACYSPEIFEYLLSKVNDPLALINTQADGHGSIPLEIAIMNNQIEIVKRCLAIDPSLMDQYNDTGWYPIHYAAKYSPEIFEYLLREANEPQELVNTVAEDEQGFTPLFIAIMNNQIEMVKRCLAIDPTLMNKTDANGFYPIHYAAFFSPEIFEYLLRGANDPRALVNQPQDNSFGDTPFFCAIKQNHLEIVKLCLAIDASLISQPNKRDRYPYHYAAQYSRTIFKYFVSEAFEPQVLINTIAEDKTPLSLAIQGGQIDNALLCLRIAPSSFLSYILENDKEYFALEEVGSPSLIYILQWLRLDQPAIYRQIYIKQDSNYRTILNIFTLDSITNDFKKGAVIELIAEADSIKPCSFSARGLTAEIIEMGLTMRIKRQLQTISAISCLYQSHLPFELITHILTFIGEIGTGTRGICKVSSDSKNIFSIKKAFPTFFKKLHALPISARDDSEVLAKEGKTHAHKRERPTDGNDSTIEEREHKRMKL